MAFRLMSQQQYNILEQFDTKKFNIIRKMMISNILATEMKEHFIMIRKLEDQFKFHGENYINKIREVFGFFV